jgi:hypothetical protein
MLPGRLSSKKVRSLLTKIKKEILIIDEDILNNINRDLNKNRVFRGLGLFEDLLLEKKEEIDPDTIFLRRKEDLDLKDFKRYN